MKIAIAASEAVPFSKTGGLADVAGTLFKEYLKRGLEAYLFVPLYRRTREALAGSLRETGLTFDVPLGRAVRECRVFTLEDDPGRVFFIASDAFFDREELYGTSAGDYPDNDQRFAFFCRGVLEACIRLALGIEVMHCNDWQTGLIPLYLKTLYRDAPALRNAVSVLTIHNLGYQGLFPPQTMAIAGLGMDLFTPEGVEFYGRVNFLKAGIVGADVITTVSTAYAKEILTHEFGFGLDGILKKRANALVGILNGIDYAEWDPAADTFIPLNYDRTDMAGKAACKKALVDRCSFPRDAGAPLLCFIGRLSAQKGLDILADAIPVMIAGGANIIIIGRGDERYHAVLGDLEDRFRGRLFRYAAFDEAFAHLAYAGADMFLMPSRYEPCGLGQMIAMRYGTIPVAHRTGGISDTVEDGVTGFLFDEYSAASLSAAAGRALDACAKKAVWRMMQKNAMSRDFSWGRSAEAYRIVYRDALTARAGVAV